ncbi:hypothetical protein psal_cds_1194 [Pandoravirus salinus]|uniref:Uncharacterized protein n=1 Tax=Pandoravirus salinus TaxID=1349410 RepID=A0A291ATR8_9VIRU|nr:hypothetical protein psal_cds_1194 [Pandoravirus salinus]ATE82291.1 hypothetical protein psal_cds_1194 [Pandoravirus salinus]
MARPLEAGRFISWSGYLCVPSNPEEQAETRWLLCLKIIREDILVVPRTSASHVGDDYRRWHLPIGTRGTRGAVQIWDMEGKPRSAPMDREPSYLKLNNVATISIRGAFCLIKATTSKKGLGCVFNILMANVSDLLLHSVRLVISCNYKLEWRVERKDGQSEDSEIVRYQESTKRKEQFRDAWYKIVTHQQHASE